jgi:hypothetical protein
MPHPAVYHDDVACEMKERMAPVYLQHLDLVMASEVE